MAAVVAGPPGLTLGNIDIGGNFNLIVNGIIVDAPGTEINVAGDANIISRPDDNGLAGIQLADSVGDLFNVGGVARFEAQSADGTQAFDIHIGIDGVGDPSPAAATFGSLSLFGDKATIVESDGGSSDGSVLDDIDVTTLDLTSAGSITDTGTTIIEVSENASFTATDPDDNAITLDDTHNFGTLTFDGGAVQIIEASSSELSGNNQAESLDLDSAGTITDTAGTVLDVENQADVESTTGDNITLDQTSTFGSLRFAGGVVEISEAAGGTAEGTLLSGTSSANRLVLTSAGPITDDAGAELAVVGNAFFDTNPAAVINLDGGANNFGSLRFAGTAVAIHEASGTVLSDVSNADVLEIISEGSISDDGTADVDVTGLAFFNSVPDLAITLNGFQYTFGQLQFDGGVVTIVEAAGGSVSGTELAGVSDALALSLTSADTITDALGAELTVTGLAFFDSTSDAEINLDGAVLEFGLLQFDGGDVTITETNQTVLSGVSFAESLSLTSGGSITDDGTAVVSVAGAAAFDSVPNALITLDDSYDFGSLTFDGGVVTIVEQSDTLLDFDSTAAVLTLDSLGSITDNGGASLDVTGNANFTALTGEAVTLDGAANTFGSLTFSGGDVSVFEAAGGAVVGTLLVGTSLAGSLALTSAGPISDSNVGATVLTVIAGARFDSTPDEAITLIDIHNFGTLTFAGGEVTIVEQSATVLTAANSAAGDLALQSVNGSITDQALTTLDVAFDAALTAAESIVLADADAQNELTIAGLGSFLAGDGREIAIGVDPPTGDPADALATIGTLQFNVFDGNARVALDGNVTLQDASRAADIELNAFGDGFDITDLAGSDLTFDRTAILRAAADNIILGDASGADASRFGQQVSPVVFSPDEFLALESANVSIVADSGINLRTGPDDSAFSGSFFLRAAGTISQVQGPSTDLSDPVLSGLTPLTADRVALASGGVEIDAGQAGVVTPAGGAVLFSQITLTGDNLTPNLAIEAGGTESFTAVIDGRVEFPTVDIAGGADGQFLPIDLVVDVPTTDFDEDDPNGLDLRDGDLIVESGAFDENGDPVTPTPLGDGFSIVAVINGDATVGLVDDATGTRADQLGVEVSDATGNTFLRTLAVDGEAIGQLPLDSPDVGFADGFPVVGLSQPSGPPSSSLSSGVVAENGDLLFTSVGALSETVVTTQEGVFTAIAAGVLSIETEAPDEAAGLITTLLVSDTGVVSSVAEFETLLGVPLDLPTGQLIDPATDLTTLSLVGPRFILDPPNNTIGAATTDLIRFGDSDDFVDGGQTITFAIGSRGEEGVLVEFEFADVNTRRESPLDLLPVSLANGGNFPGEVIVVDGEEFFDPLNDTRLNPLDTVAEVDATLPSPVVAVTAGPTTLDALPLSDAVTQTSDPNIEFRVVTVTHVFTEEFVQTFLDPDVFEDGVVRPVLPTTIRVFNDPLINLFDTDGARSFNENVNFLETDLPQTPAFSEQQPPIEVSSFPVVETPIFFAPTAIPPSPAASADLQTAISSDVEVIYFGRIDGVDEDDDGFADDTPGEEWPLQWEGDEEDFIDSIRTLVDDGAFSEGEYKIITKSPRGEQQLDVWTKGDRGPEQAIDTEQDEELTVPDQAKDQPQAKEQPQPKAVDEAVDFEGPLLFPVGEGAPDALEKGELENHVSWSELTRTADSIAATWQPLDVSLDTPLGDTPLGDTPLGDTLTGVTNEAIIGAAGLVATTAGKAMHESHLRAARRRRRLKRSLATAAGRRASGDGKRGDGNLADGNLGDGGRGNDNRGDDNRGNGGKPPYRPGAPK